MSFGRTRYKDSRYAPDYVLRQQKGLLAAREVPMQTMRASLRVSQWDKEPPETGGTHRPLALALIGGILIMGSKFAVEWLSEPGPAVSQEGGIGVNPFAAIIWRLYHVIDGASVVPMVTIVVVLVGMGIVLRRGE